MFRSSVSALRRIPAVQQAAPLRRFAALPRQSLASVRPAGGLAPSSRAFATSHIARQAVEDEMDEDEYYVGQQIYGSQVAVQRPAPYFKGTAVVEGAFEDVSLADYKGKWLVLFFYPMDFTFVCPTEILAFDRALPQFKALNTELLAVSTDSEYSHLAWANLSRPEGGLGPNLKIPLFSDKNHSMATKYGVLLPQDGIALRGLFLIDPKGITRQITINDLPVGRSVEETIRLIKAFQFTDEHGEVCPADWSPDGNSATIKPSPTESKEYFGKQVVDKVKEVL